MASLRETKIFERQARIQKGSGHGKKLDPEKIARAKAVRERRNKALSLRMAGATLQDIVNAGIGYNTTGGVQHDLNKEMESFFLEAPEQLLILDLARLDEMQRVCTAALRMGNTAEVRNLLAIMTYRRETMGITLETIQQARTDAAQVVNNGIMVVQGSTSEYIDGMMRKAGIPDEVRERELKALENSSESVPEQKVITGEVITGEVIGSESAPVSSTSSNPSANHSSKGQRKPGKPLRIRVRKNTAEPGPPEDVQDKVLRIAEQIELDMERSTELKPGSLSAPAVEVNVEALEKAIVQGSEKVLEVPVKAPDHNMPASPGVVYRAAPRKLRIRKPGSPAVDKLLTGTEVQKI